MRITVPHGVPDLTMLFVLGVGFFVANLRRVLSVRPFLAPAPVRRC